MRAGSVAAAIGGAAAWRRGPTGRAGLARGSGGRSPPTGAGRRPLADAPLQALPDPCAEVVLPARSTLHAVLDRHGLVEHASARGRRIVKSSAFTGQRLGLREVDAEV